MARRPRKLPRSFYERPTLEVSRDLPGKYIVYRSSEGDFAARIVEVEAYIGEDDPACHAARGETDRNRVMFGQGGFAYIYFVYGMYHCLNFVTEGKGFPAAVLLRAAEPAEGVEQMLTRSPKTRAPRLLNGPGKFCRAFGLTREQNGLDLTGDRLYLEDRFGKPTRIVRTSRIGIRVGRDRLYRFCEADSTALSRPLR